MSSKAGKLLSFLTLACALAACAADQSLRPGTNVPSAGGTGPRDFLVIPSATNWLQFRICTNAAPDSAHLVNTVEIEACGETLLKSPGASLLPHWLEPTNSCFHNIVLNSAGPRL